MLIVKDMSTGEIEMQTLDDYEEETLSSGWNPAIADLIHREIDRYEISQAEHPMPADLAEIDVEAFLDRMYAHLE